jgi:4-hydroxy-3-methylbut-2-enyl diphosphate reductase
MKTFKVPEFYRSPIISRVKQFRKIQDPRKKDNSPTVLDFGRVKYYVARYFGFCYGVENAIEIAFRALEENPGKELYLLSEMIHNPDVNRDLLSRGVKFLQDTHGKQLIPFETLGSDDIVIIPAFGAPLPLLKQLEEKGIATEKYDTTCPFVERVWKKSAQIGKEHFTIIIHGKHDHEETRSTFSRSAVDSEAAIVVRDLDDAKRLGEYILGNKGQAEFENEFGGRYTPGFNVSEHLQRVGVINQTTMLATETQAIADYFRQLMIMKYGDQEYTGHFADTRDTLCYATNENQDATHGLLATDADLAIVAGGYNSSNTSHLVELCEEKFPTYFINSEQRILDAERISHYDYHNRTEKVTQGWLPEKKELKIVITSGASCPDSLLDAIVHRINNLVGVDTDPETVMRHLATYNN